MHAELAMTLFESASMEFDPSTLEMLLRRIRGEFRDMPGLALTPAQASRLFGIDARVCDRVLSALVEGRHLLRCPDGRFRRPV